MRNSQKGSATVVLSIIIVLLIVAFGAYYIHVQNKRISSQVSSSQTANSQPAQKTPATETPTSTNTSPSVAIDQSSLILSSWQTPITGTATNASAVSVDITEAAPATGTGYLHWFGNESVPVVNGRWSISLDSQMFATFSSPLQGPFVLHVGVVDASGAVDVLATGTLEAPQSPAPISVAGMAKYIDSTLGFSFWYPTTWQVTQVAVQNQNKYPGGTVIRQLNVTNGQRLITLEEFTSPTLSITDSTGVGACPVCNTTEYYFDPSLHTWMVEFPDGTDAGPGSPQGPSAANVDTNTMGGLHMLAGSQRFGANVIIPLSAHNFVIVTVDGAIATGSSDAQALAKTIVAADPSVATPWSADLQTQIIQAELSAYAELEGIGQ